MTNSNTSTQPKPFLENDEMIAALDHTISLANHGMQCAADCNDDAAYKKQLHIRHAARELQIMLRATR